MKFTVTLVLSVLTFSYEIRNGDSTPALDVKGIDFQMGVIFNPLTGAEVSTVVPGPGANTRSMSIAAQSLSYNVIIQIKTKNPSVILVSSPNENGIYTLGDLVTVHVIFDIPIKVYKGEVMVVRIPAGTFVREAKFVGLLPDKKTLSFVYEIQV
jgi:hypothetical protein